MAKNDGTPVNLLALDGGGIRGICELRVLDEIMKRVQKEQNLTELPRPCDYFNLMAGTSTGGLVAILLSRFKMTTRDAIAAYYDFSSKIFSKKNKIPFTVHEFNETVLEQIIKDMVAAKGIGELLLETKPSALSQAFVCSQRGHNQGPVVRFRTYEAPANPAAVNSSVSNTDVSRANSSVSSGSAMTNVSGSTIGLWGNFDDIKIWEAARATTAAPGYFKPMKFFRDEKKIMFIDGAMGCNNPAYELVDEATALFGTDCVLGCLVSLGTGFTGPKTIGDRKGWLGKIDLLMNVKKIVTDTENVHLGLSAQMRSELDTYFRFQLPTGAEGVGLHDYEKLDYLSQLMQDYIEKESAQIDKVVQILIGRAKPRGVTLGQIVRSDHGQICPPKKEIRSRPLVSDFFVGREDILEKLAEAFNPNAQPPNRKRQHLLYGQPGMGKSQTAAKFLDEYGHWFDMILWVDACSKDTLEASFKDLNGCSEYGFKGDGSVKPLLRWLETTERTWILVMDDVRGDVSEYVPRGNKGNVLFTSQNMSMKPKLRGQSMTKVDVLNETDAALLLLYCAHSDGSDMKKWTEAMNLSEMLGYLPLALEQAGATLRMRDYGISQYAEILENHRNDLLKASGSENIPAALQAVYTSFDVTYKVLNTRAHDASNEEQAEAAKNALQLLSLFSFFHNEGLMGAILQRAFKYRPPDRRPDELGIGIQSFNDLLAADESGKWIDSRWRSGVDLLIGYSLVKPDQTKKFFSMHGLVHDWARNRMPTYIRCAQAKAARLVLFDSLTDYPRTTEDYLYRSKLLPHARTAMKNTDGIEFDDQILIVTHYYRFGLMLMESRLYTEAYDTILAGLRIWCKKHGGVGDEGELEMWGALSDASRHRGRLYNAFNFMNLVHDTSRKRHGDQDVRTYYALTRLLSIYIDLGRFDGVLGMLLENMSTVDLIFQKKKGMPMLSEVGVRLFGLDRPDARRDVVLSLFRRQGKLPFMTDLAVALFYLGRLEEARDIMVDVVHEAINMVGDRHPWTFKAISNLAVVQTRLGSCEEAEEMLLNVLEAEDELYGPYYADRTSSLHNLATAYFYQERFEDADRLFWEARDLHDSVCELLDTRYPPIIQGMSITAYRRGRREDAINLGILYHKSLKIMLLITHCFTQAAKWQLKCWFYEEEHDLPIQTSTATQIQPVFRLYF
ncbi:FabD/lysophospholipase-like protein [Xylariaceae sp. FL0662B]|nr:FabD/lysophospholipase-like protein [Xylariaceae sp. FL0662B]